MSGGPIGPTDRDGMRIYKGDKVLEADPDTGATLHSARVTWVSTGQPWKIDVRWDGSEIDTTIDADSIIVVPRGSK